MPKKKRGFKESLKIWIPVLILLGISIIIASRYVEPPPPKRFVLATGGLEGAYYAFGKQYKDSFAKDGITVEVVKTAGSLENLKLLDSGQVDIAFVQGGVRHKVKTTNELYSLASIYYEPLWAFYRGEEEIERLTQLQGKRISIGEQGSGAQPVAKLLLEMNGLTEENTEFFEMGFEEAATALKNGELDAAFFVTSPEALIIKRLLWMEGVHLMNFRRHSAYVKNLSFIKDVIIPEGLVDLKHNIPGTNTTLLSTTATLVGRADTHPRLVEHILMTIDGIHTKKGILEAEGEFPTGEFVDFPLYEAAESYFRAGPSFLSRYLPFWAVSLISRLKILILPALTLLVPFLKIAPIAYRWGMEKSIYKWYDVLDDLEERLENEMATELLEKGIIELKELEGEVDAVSVPPKYRKEIYDLRMHINYIIGDLESRLNAGDEEIET